MLLTNSTLSGFFKNISNFISFSESSNKELAFTKGIKITFWSNSANPVLKTDEILNFISNDKSKKILDIGTGSGCIIVSLIKERPKWVATAIDISKKAIIVAKTNAKLHHLENKINFINIDIDKYKSCNYDLIISNPPYISCIELNRLDDDIKSHEPKLALSGGSDGFREIKKVIIKSKELLRSLSSINISISEGRITRIQTSTNFSKKKKK